jgi:hypothetical protein
MSCSRFVPLALGAWLAPVLAFTLFPANATEAASALACAKADLALLHKLADEPGASALTAARLAQASVRVLDARAACRAGQYANGIDLYAEADALAGAAAASTLMERR